MKVFAYFVEPASYTLDLIYKVHNRLNIAIAFISKRTVVGAKNDSIPFDMYNTYLSDFKREKFGIP